MDSSSPPAAVVVEDTKDAKEKHMSLSIDARDAVKTDITGDIDPANEVQGVRLLLIHISICLCTFLIGLVSVNLDQKDVHTKDDRTSILSPPRFPSLRASSTQPETSAGIVPPSW